MKNLYKISSEKKFRGIFKESVSDIEEFHDDIVKSDMLSVNESSFSEDQKNALAGLAISLGLNGGIFGSLRKFFGELEEVVDEKDDNGNSAELVTEESGKSSAKLPEVKKTIIKEYETVEFGGNILENARWFIGLNEARDGDGDREEIKKMHKAAGEKFGAETAWCASFVSYVLQKSGVEISGSVRAKDFLDKGEEINKKELRKGDVIVYDRGGSKGHIGFFTGKYKGDIPIIIAGNTSDEVKEYAEEMPIVGYRRFS